MVDKRNYTIYWSVIGFKGGSYKSINPTSAAKKAGNRLFKLASDDKKFTKYKSAKTIKFVIRETTRGSAHNIYTYVATRTKLKVPKIVTIAGKEIVYNFTIDVVPGSLNKQESKIVGGNNMDDMDTALNGIKNSFENLFNNDNLEKVEEVGEVEEVELEKTDDVDGGDGDGDGGDGDGTSGGGAKKAKKAKKTQKAKGKSKKP